MRGPHLEHEATVRLAMLTDLMAAVLMVGGMDHAPSAPQCLELDAGNLSVADANVACGIKAGVGIHDTSAVQHQIVLLCGRDGR